eukprot:PhM_4_TR5767/c0_g1_i1/m.79805
MFRRVLPSSVAPWRRPLVPKMSHYKCTLLDSSQRLFYSTREPKPAANCPFRVLDLDELTASEQDVKLRYNKLVKEHHPDVGGDPNTFRRITTARDEALAAIELRTEEQRSAGADRAERQEDRRRPFEDNFDEKFRKASASDPEFFSEIARMRRMQISQALEFAESIPEVIDILTQTVQKSISIYEGRQLADPLLFALRAIVRLSPTLGNDHLDVCFQCMTLWEVATNLVCPRDGFHIILTAYGSDAALSTMTATDVAEQATRVLDEMRNRDVDSDDWTIFLSTKIFRASPYPDW